MIIQTEDGTKIQVDDGSTPSQIDDVLSHFNSTQTITGKVGQDLSNAVTTGKQIENSSLNPVAKTLAYVGKVGANTAMNVAGDIIPQPVKDAAGAAAGLIEKGASYLPGMQSYSDATNKSLQGVGQLWNKFKQDNPNIAASAEGIGDVANLAGTLAAANGAVSGARGAVNALSDKMSDLPIGGAGEAAPKLSLAEQAAADKAKASAGYNAQSDIPFSDEQMGTLKNNLSSLVPQRDAALRAWNKTAASGHVNDLLDTMNTEPLTFDGALAQRSAINDSWAAAKRAGKDAEASQIMDVKDALDKSMVSPDTGEWQGANRQFGIAATKQDFSDMVESAFDKSQPANSLDNSINKYLGSWRGNTLSDGERNILEQITKNSFTKDLKRNVASRLTGAVATGIGGVVGGVPGAVAGDLLGSFASKLARDSAMSEKVAALQNFFDELDKRPMPVVPQAPVKPPMLALPGGGATMYVDNLGNISKTPNPAMQLSGAQQQAGKIWKNLKGAK